MPLRGALICFLLLLAHAAAGIENVLSNEWLVAIHDHVNSAPAIANDGTICFGTWKGELWALNPDGSRKWVFRAGNEIKSSPAIAPDGTVYFGSRDRKLYAIRPDGTRQWEVQTGAWVDSSPALAGNGTVCVGSWDKSFYCVNANGRTQWQFKTGGPIVSSPAIGQGGTIYFGSHDKKVYALAPDGSQKWAFATGGPIISSPALNGDQCLYITSVDGCLYAINLDGSLRWRLRTGGITESSPVIGPDGTVYLGAFGHPWAVTAEGKKKWGLTGDDEYYPFDTSATVLADGTILCVFRNGVLAYLSPEMVMRPMYDLAVYGYGAPAIGPTGMIYVPDCSSPKAPASFSAVRAGVSLARTPWPKFRGNTRNTGNIQDAGR